jgi:hypothetical protein
MNSTITVITATPIVSVPVLVADDDDDGVRLADVSFLNCFENALIFFSCVDIRAATFADTARLISPGGRIS